MYTIQEHSMTLYLSKCSFGDFRNILNIFMTAMITFVNCSPPALHFPTIPDIHFGGDMTMGNLTPSMLPWWLRW